MPEPQKEKEAPTITRGYLFTEKVNQLFEAQNDDNMLGLNANIIGPIFNETIEQLHREGKDLHAQTIWLTTCLRLHDELKAKEEKWPSQYFVKETVTIQALVEISNYLSKHPETLKAFYEIEALKHFPKQDVDF